MPKKHIFIKIRDWYFHFERPISSLSLIAGFVFNALVLTRVDLFWENFWIVVHLLIVSVCIVLINREADRSPASELEKEKDPSHIQFWLITVLQFTFGGLMSTFIVFYFRSGVLAVTWPFFLMLGSAFIANERLKQQYARTAFQIVFLFLSLLLFAIYFVPVLTHKIGPSTFLLSGAVSLILIFIFLGILRITAKKRFHENRAPLMRWIVGMFIVINALYFLNLVPPLPLSAEDAGVYHLVARTAEGNYAVQTETPQGLFAKAFSNLGWNTTYTTPLYAPVYAYSAVFSPVAFATDILHEWQYYDASQKKWIDSGSVRLPIIGGRDGGYRTYSVHRVTAPGKWRVNITTPSGQLIGRISFTAVISQSEPQTVTIIK
jgi:hypothetical protein